MIGMGPATTCAAVMRPMPVLAPSAADGGAEQPELVAEERTHGDVDEQFEERVGYAEPEDGKVEERYRVDAMLGEVLVECEADEGQPRQPESHDEDEAHEVRRIGEVLAESRGVLLVLGEQRVAHLSHRAEYVEVGVGDGGECGSEDEDDERHRVGGHARPVQVADERLAIEDGLDTVARRALQQRWAASEHGREPREDDPTLAPGRRLDRFVAQRLANGQIPID